MAESNAPQPDHPLVSHLDPVFTGPGGNAPALAGWLEYLAHPEQNTGPRVVEFAGGDAIESNGKPHDISHIGERTVLRDLTLDRFFAHADVLSGQQLGTLDENGEIPNTQALGTTFDLIQEVAVRPGAHKTVPGDISADVWTAFTKYVDLTVDLENWQGVARDKALDKYTALTKWYDNHRTPALGRMAGYLVKYAAILMTARQDVNELMGKTVTALENEAASNALDDLTFAVSLLGKAVSLAVNFPKTGLDAAVIVTDVVKEVLGVLTKPREPNGFGIDTTDVYLRFYRLFEDFIQAGDRVCRDAAAAVDGLINDGESGMRHVRRDWKDVPAWPH